MKSAPSYFLLLLLLLPLPSILPLLPSTLVLPLLPPLLLLLLLVRPSREIFRGAKEHRRDTNNDEGASRCFRKIEETSSERKPRREEEQRRETSFKDTTKGGASRIARVSPSLARSFFLSVSFALFLARSPPSPQVPLTVPISSRLSLFRFLSYVVLEEREGPPRIERRAVGNVTRNGAAA